MTSGLFPTIKTGRNGQLFPILSSSLMMKVSKSHRSYHEPCFDLGKIGTFKIAGGSYTFEVFWAKGLKGLDS
jgi:hypothetical protein